MEMSRKLTRWSLREDVGGGHPPIVAIGGWRIGGRGGRAIGLGGGRIGGRAVSVGGCSVPTRCKESNVKHR